MRTNARKLLSHLLVALYGSVSLLGYGLHELAPETGHHHGLARRGIHAITAIQAMSTSHLQRDSTGSAEDAHDCDVCVFLDQLRSEQPQVHAAVVWHEFVSAVADAQAAIHFSGHAWSPRRPRSAGQSCRLTFCCVRVRQAFLPDEAAIRCTSGWKA